MSYTGQSKKSVIRAGWTFWQVSYPGHIPVVIIDWFKHDTDIVNVCTSICKLTELIAGHPTTICAWSTHGWCIGGSTLSVGGSCGNWGGSVLLTKLYKGDSKDWFADHENSTCLMLQNHGLK